MHPTGNLVWIESLLHQIPVLCWIYVWAISQAKKTEPQLIFREHSYTAKFRGIPAWLVCKFINGGFLVKQSCFTYLGIKAVQFKLAIGGSVKKDFVLAQCQQWEKKNNVFVGKNNSNKYNILLLGTILWREISLTECYLYKEQQNEVLPAFKFCRN